MDTGWIKLYRKTLDDEIFQNEKLLKVFIWCLLKATHKSHTQMVGLLEVLLQEGQFITGRKKAALELNMNESTSWKYILKLKALGVIKVDSNNKFSVITIDKWRFYQSKNEVHDNKITSSEEKKPVTQPVDNQTELKGDNKITAEPIENSDVEPCVFLKTEQQNDNKVTTKEQQNNTNKNDKNVKNEKNKETKAISYLVEHVQSKIMMKKTNIDILISYLDKMEAEAICMAVDIAINKKKPYIGFIQGILNNWINVGCLTAEQVKENEKGYIKNKEGVQGGCNTGTDRQDNEPIEDQFGEYMEKHGISTGDITRDLPY